MGSFDVPLNDERTQLDAFVEEYRRAIEATLDGLTEAHHCGHADILREQVLAD
ncbi:hypothetical protein [Amycolatopsis antarctica]|uniref:hypothetical protein n=1 Tax=Amycolatopsis antarctica TaxID=1854586 RepID=UPI0013FD6071|nr:hypothetical protein [Amycolatopsis antarctica]